MDGFFKPLIKSAVKEALAEERAKVASKKEADEWLDSVQSAEFLRMSPSTFLKGTSKREIPHYKRGGKILCKRSELIAFLEKGRQKSRDELLGGA